MRKDRYWKLCRLRAKDRHFVYENTISNVTQYIYTLFTLYALHGQIHTLHRGRNICRPVQLTPVGGPTVRECEDITVISLSQCAAKYNHRELEVELCTLLY